MERGCSHQGLRLSLQLIPSSISATSTKSLMRLSAPHHRYNNFVVKSSPTPIPIPIPIPIVSMASKQDKQGSPLSLSFIATLEFYSRHCCLCVIPGSPVKNVAVIGAGVR